MAGETLVRDISPDQFAIADLGQYFAANNAQTGIATAAAPTAFSATNPFLVVVNKDASGGKNIYLDFVTLVNTAPGTAGASLQVAVALDNTNRYTSGGTDITANIVNTNGNVGNKSIAQVVAGNITAAAATGNVRNVVGNRYLKGAIPVAGDEYTLKFGGVDAPSAIQISTISKVEINVPKIVVPPGWTALVHIWLPSQSAASSYAPELGWVER